MAANRTTPSPAGMDARRRIHPGSPGNNRAKWGLVAVLVLALTWVLSRPGRKEPPAVSSTPAIPAGNRPVAGSGTRTPVGSRPLEPVTVAAALSYNPFEYDGKSAGLPQPVPSQPAASGQRPPAVAVKPAPPPDMRNALRKSMAGKVADIIFESPRGRSARVGERVVREGKPLRRGIIVRRIQPDNVILEIAPRGPRRHIDGM